MIRNLISNGIKFTGKNGKVQVTTEIVEMNDDSNNISTHGLDKDTDADVDFGSGPLQFCKVPERQLLKSLNKTMLVVKVTDSGAGMSAVSHSFYSFADSFICNRLLYAHMYTAGKSKEIISFCGSI